MIFQCDREVAEAVIISLQLIQGIIVIKTSQSLNVNNKQTKMIRDKIVNYSIYKKNEISEN